MDIATGVQKARRFVASLSMVTLLASLAFAGINVAQAATFQDVPANAWFYTYVEQLSAAGILDTTQQNYRPADNANRAEAAKLLVEAAGLTIDTSAGPSFKDVAPGAWYYQYVETAAKNGVVSGYTDASGNLTGMFGPGDAVTREQFAKMAVNAFAMKANTTGGPHFPDVGTDRWSYSDIETLYNNSVVDGYPDGTFGPTMNINRAEIAKMVVGAKNPVPRGSSTGTGTSTAFNLQTATATSATAVSLTFSQNVDPTTGALATNYSIKDVNNNVVAVSAAVVSTNMVTLTTASQTPNQPYIVTVTNVIAQGGKTLDTGTADFNGYNPLGQGGPLTVALDANTPKSASLPLGASGVPFACWDFTAGSAPVVVQSLTVHSTSGGNADYANVYLYEGANRLTEGRSLNSQDQTAAFSNVNVNIAAGAVAELCAVADIATNATVAAGHAFEIQAATAITTNASSVGGTFPLTGNVMTINGSQVGSATISANGSLSQITIGQSQARIAQFEIAAGTSEDESLQRLALDVRGTIQQTDLTNFNLYVTGSSNTTPLATASAVDSTGLATFVLTTPYVISRGQNQIFYVTADVKGRNGDEIKVYLDEPTDVLIVGNTFGFGVQVNDATAVGAPGYDGALDGSTAGYSDTTVIGSEFTVAFNGPAAANIAVGQQNTHCMNLTLTNSSNSPVDLRNWEVTVADTAGALYTNSQSNFSVIKLVQLNSDGTIGSTLLGSNELSTTGSATSQQVELSGDYTMAAGASLQTAIVFNVSSLATSGDVVTCTLQDLTNTTNGGVRDINNDTLTASSITPATNITGNQLTVSTAGLTFGVSGTPSSQTYVAGTNNAALLGLTVSAGTTLSDTLNSIAFQGYINGEPSPTTDTWSAGIDTTHDGSSTNLKDDVDSLGLYMNGQLVSQLANVDASTGTVTFNSLNIPVPANNSVNLTLEGHINNSAPRGAVDDLVKFTLPSTNSIVATDSNGQTVSTQGITDSAINGGADTIATDAAANNVYMRISNGGTGTTGQVATSTVASVVTGDPSNQLELARWQFTSQNDSPLLNNLQLGVLNTTNASIASVYLYTGSTCSTPVGNTTGGYSSTGTGIFNINALGAVIPSGSNLTLCAKGVVNQVNSSGQPVTGSHVGLVLLNVTQITGGNGTNVTSKYIGSATGTTLATALTNVASGTTVTTNVTAGISTVGTVLLVDQEEMLVTVVPSSTTFTVVRGFANTTVANHAVGAPVYYLPTGSIATPNAATATAITSGILNTTANTGMSAGDVLSWNDANSTATNGAEYALVTAVCTGTNLPVTGCATGYVAVTPGLYGSSATPAFTGTHLTDFTLHGPLNELRASKPTITINSTPNGQFALPQAGTNGSATVPKTATTGTTVLSFNVAATGQNDVMFNAGNQIQVTMSGKEAGTTLGTGATAFTCTLTDGSKNYDTEQIGGGQPAIATFTFASNTLDVAKGTNVNLQVVCNLSGFTQIGDTFSASLATAPTTVTWYDSFASVNLDGALIVPTTLSSLASFTNN